MLSLPLIAPQNEYTFFLSPHLRPSWSSDADNNNQYNTTNPSSQQSQQMQNSRRQQHPSQSSRSSLAQLQADELAIATRKHNIRRFGAAWIKPPGVTKTLQAETEERAEREEQEAMQRREQMMMDMQAQQEAEEARQRAAEGGENEDEEEEEEEERDLDEEIPDADVEENEDEDEELTDSDEEDEDEEDEDEEEQEEGEIQEERDHRQDQSMVEEPSLLDDTLMSLLENSFMPDESDEQRLRMNQERYARLEEAELTGIAQDEADLGIERDLDDSVPEAGSYQHTDSELDDSDDDDDDSDEQDESEEQDHSGMMVQDISGVDMEGSDEVGAVMQRSRSSLLSRDVNSLLDSSFVASSPAVGRLRSAHRGGASQH